MQEQFLGDLQREGFHIHSGTQQLDFHIQNSSTNRLTTHYILLKDSAVIHIAVFYRRVPRFLWHGSLTGAELPENLVRENELKHWKHEGAFDK